MPVEVFLSYAHEDELLRHDLECHLATMLRAGLIASWSLRCIAADNEWGHQVSKQVHSAQIILLLLSPDFLASDYGIGIEMKVALERHRQSRAKVIPIILRPADRTATPYSHLPALPQNARPVTEWPSPEQAFANVAKSLREIIESHPEGSKNHTQAANGENGVTIPQLTKKRGTFTRYFFKGEWQAGESEPKTDIEPPPDQPPNLRTTSTFSRYFSRYLAADNVLPKQEPPPTDLSEFDRLFNRNDEMAKPGNNDIDPVETAHQATSANPPPYISGQVKTTPPAVVLISHPGVRPKLGMIVFFAALAAVSLLLILFAVLTTKY